jgi:hypothetical protein
MRWKDTLIITNTYAMIHLLKNAGIFESKYQIIAACLPEV